MPKKKQYQNQSHNVTFSHSDISYRISVIIMMKRTNESIILKKRNIFYNMVAVFFFVRHHRNCLNFRHRFIETKWAFLIIARNQRCERLTIMKFFSIFSTEMRVPVHSLPRETKFCRVVTLFQFDFYLRTKRTKR